MNYGHIAKAVEFYQERGYIYLDEAPWQVGKEAYHMTRPDGSRDIMMNVCEPGIISFPSDPPYPEQRIYPVASGEQSFIQMMIDGQPIKRAICVTPCYRYEPRADLLHRQYFMKAELINAQDVDVGHLIHMIHDACSFFESVGISVRVIDTTPSQMYHSSFDIVEKGSRYELGSYGIRRHWLADGRELEWIYGTACAEPRLSTAIQKSMKHAGR